METNIATWEEARRCPMCDLAGDETAQRRLPRGMGRLVTLMCRNARCKWFDTPWTVQVNPDGTIPIREAAGEKKFPALDAAFAERVASALAAEAEAQTKTGAEVRRR